MNCPHCWESIKYKERSNKVCPKCRKEFAFEPKTHPLLLNDTLFKKVIAKIGNNEKIYFTPQQLQFALSKKKIKSRSKLGWLYILAFLSLFFIGFGTGSLIIILCLIGFWIVIFLLSRVYLRRNLRLPQTLPEFESSVLRRWMKVYKTDPSTLIVKNPLHNYFNYDLKGVLICESDDTAKCLAANHTERDLGLALFCQKPSYEVLRDQVTTLFQKSGDLPVYVLHDASIKGCAFFEKTKRELGHGRRVFDIGLRPREVMKSKLTKFRRKDVSTAEIKEIEGLTKEEAGWLADGFYTPLFTLMPARLISYVTQQVEKKTKFIKSNERNIVQREAQAVGFMTWVGE